MDKKYKREVDKIIDEIDKLTVFIINYLIESDQLTFYDYSKLRGRIILFQEEIFKCFGVNKLLEDKIKDQEIEYIKNDVLVIRKRCLNSLYGKFTTKDNESEDK